MFKFIIVLSAVLFLGSKPLAAQALSQLWQSTLNNNLDLQIAARRVQQESQVYAVTPGYWAPTVSLSSTGQRSDTWPNQGQAKTTSYTTGANVQVTQNILNNPNVLNQQLSEGRVKQAEVNLELKKKELIFKLVSVYIEAAQRKTALRAARLDLDTVKQQKASVRLKVKARFQSAADLDQINLLMERKLLQISQLRTSYEDLLFQLRAMTHLSKIKLPLLATLDLEWLQKETDEDSELSDPQIEANLVGIRLQQTQIKQIELGLLPTVSTFLNASANDSRAEILPKKVAQRNVGLTLGLSLNWVLSDAGASRPNLTTSFSEISLLKYQTRELEWQRKLNLVRFDSTLERSIKSWQRSQNIVKLTESLVQTTAASVEANLRNSDSLIDVQGQLGETKVAVADAAAEVLKQWLAIRNERNELKPELLDVMNTKFFIFDNEDPLNLP